MLGAPLETPESERPDFRTRHIVNLNRAFGPVMKRRWTLGRNRNWRSHLAEKSVHVVKKSRRFPFNLEPYLLGRARSLGKGHPSG